MKTGPLKRTIMYVIALNKLVNINYFHTLKLCLYEETDKGKDNKCFSRQKYVRAVIRNVRMHI